MHDHYSFLYHEALAASSGTKRGFIPNSWIEL
jgi:hypothetical protein